MTPDSVSSLDSSPASSDDGYDSDEELRVAQQEWEENLHQLQLLVSVVLLPYVGKWLGRKWAHSIYARYVQLGLGHAFFLGGRSS
ncbi:hypothetical protein DFH11DRAFT_1722224 [Phellopilus nigrolimitatus]|nr:hypothetical protein DFH11DRAFT_1722224 [Phellopilus nigrolimitatus]